MTEPVPNQIKPDASQQRLNGVIDVLRTSRIAGWAIDRLDANAAVTVDILKDGQLYRTVVADRYRPDLEKGGLGTGRYGFSAEITPPVTEGLEFTLTAVAKTADGHQVALNAVGPASHASKPDLLLLHRLLVSVEELKASHRQSMLESEKSQAVVERIEMTQIRLEASLSTAALSTSPQIGAGMPKVAYGAIAVGLVSLTTGLASLWFSF
jgi:hypothetical protein